MVQGLRLRSEGHHDPEVMGSSPGQVELGVHSTVEAKL